MDGHGEELVAIHGDMFRNRLRAHGFSVEKTLVLPTVPVIGDDSRDPIRASVADGISQKEKLDNRGIGVSRLNQNDMLADHGLRQTNISFAVRKSAGVPFKRDFESLLGKFAGQGFREMD